MSARCLLLGAVSALAICASNGAQAAGAAAAAARSGDPYSDYAALEPYLGNTFFERLINYYRLEWGKDGPPQDPKAPPGRRAEFPPAPQSTPPMPFTEWPYGGSSNLGATRPNSVDSPLMVALGNTPVGQWLGDNHVQVYGWVAGGGNLSTNNVRGGNAPAAYAYKPNTVQFNQAAVYIERLPDTVQKTSVDWGFRFAPIFGSDYRYTTAYGLFSYQYLKRNHENGFDIPMAYGEVFVPQVLDGLMFRFGRYISLPDIEAQLAPNNYMYSHSLAYTFDNYTNTGLNTTLAVNKNFFAQFGVSVGTDTSAANVGRKLTNVYPNGLYSDPTFLKDPGARPSFTGCLRYQTDDAMDAIYACTNSRNSGTWGYNNLQWTGFTYFHKFNDQFHVSFEYYYQYQKNVPNLNNAMAVDAISNGGTPFSPQFVPRNAPNAARCDNPYRLSCTASSQGVLAYWNYKVTPLDNITLRTEYYDDMQGQRTGTKTRYVDFGLGLQHWFSPQIEFRPEVTYYKALDAAAFNGNVNRAITPTRKDATIAAADLIIHF